MEEWKHSLFFNYIGDGNSILYGDDVRDSDKEGHHNEAAEVNV